jgi:hypothetical protein
MGVDLRGGASVGLFSPKCPVNDRERTWIDENLAWLTREFGSPGQAILPTAEYFPQPFSGSDDDVRILVHTVAGYMRAPAGLEITFSDELDDLGIIQGLVPGGTTHLAGAAGSYTADTLTIDRSSIREPARLIAVIAHELGHARLLGEGRVAAERKDHEPLTDLLTVHLGMGIFTANAAFSFTATSDSIRGTGGWRARRLGYMTEQMFGYALACYTMQHGELRPPWVKFLNTNPRAYMRTGLRFLNKGRK